MAAVGFCGTGSFSMAVIVMPDKIAIIAIGSLMVSNDWANDKISPNDVRCLRL